jgi:hypothetical protein
MHCDRSVFLAKSRSNAHLRVIPEDILPMPPARHIIINHQLQYHRPGREGPSRDILPSRMNQTGLAKPVRSRPACGVLMR